MGWSVFLSFCFQNPFIFHAAHHYWCQQHLSLIPQNKDVHCTTNGWKKEKKKETKRRHKLRDVDDSSFWLVAHSFSPPLPPSFPWFMSLCTRLTQLSAASWRTTWQASESRKAGTKRIDETNINNRKSLIEVNKGSNRWTTADCMWVIWGCMDCCVFSKSKKKKQMPKIRKKQES